MKKILIFTVAVQVLFSGCYFLDSKKESNYNFIKGLNEYQKNNKVLALEEYTKAYNSNKKNIAILNEIAFLYADLGNYEESEKFYKKVLKIKPNNELALKNLLQLLYAQNKKIEMGSYIPMIIDRNSFLYNLNNFRLSLLENKESEIEKYLLKINSDDNFLEDYNESFYMDLLKVNTLQENVKIYSKDILEKAYKKYSSQYKNITKIYAKFLMEIKEYEKAEDILMKFLVNDDRDLEIYSLLDILYKKEDNRQKLENLRKILKNKI